VPTPSKISSKFAHNILSYPADKQTNRQTEPATRLLLRRRQRRMVRTAYTCCAIRSVNAVSAVVADNMFVTNDWTIVLYYTHARTGGLHQSSVLLSGMAESISDTGYCDVCYLERGLSVRLSVTLVHCAKVAGRNEMPFSGDTRVRQCNTTGVPVPQRKRNI